MKIATQNYTEFAYTAAITAVVTYLFFCLASLCPTMILVLLETEVTRRQWSLEPCRAYLGPSLKKLMLRQKEQVLAKEPR